MKELLAKLNKKSIRKSRQIFIIMEEEENNKAIEI